MVNGLYRRFNSSHQHISESGVGNLQSIICLAVFENYMLTINVYNLALDSGASFGCFRGPFIKNELSPGNPSPFGTRCHDLIFWGG